MPSGETKKATRKAAEPVIDLHDDDFGMMLNCAVRYACGRQSYMPGAVRRYITPLLPYLSSKALWCFDQDISEARHFGNCGDPRIDLPGWIDFHERVREERIKRGENVYTGWWEGRTE